MKKILTVLSLALLLVAFGAAQWGQAGHSKAHGLRQRVVKLERQVKQLQAQVTTLADDCITDSEWAAMTDSERAATPDSARC